MTNPKKTISAEDLALLKKWNETKRDYPHITLPELLDAQCTKTPEGIAVIFGDKKLTYKELHQQANQWAHYLREQGVGRNTLVAVYMPRCMELVIALLAILKAGGAYLPIDVKQPVMRVKGILKDSKVMFCITKKELMGTINIDVKFMPTDSILRSASHYSLSSPTVINNENDLSYVIYTSGSTGEPKGVENIQKGTINILTWLQEYFHLSEQDKLLQKTSFGFDLSVPEFFWPLSCGASIVLASHDSEQDINCLINDIIYHEITIIQFVPSMLDVFINCQASKQCTSLKDVICIGEPLFEFQKNNFLNMLGARLTNCYGPTEASVYVSYFPCQKKTDNLERSEIVAIGKPLANTQMYVLNDNQHMIGIGEIGELFIVGKCLAQGYRNNLALTKEKFVEILSYSGEPVRAYKTGDLVRWSRDGNLEFLKRNDIQMKICGFRVEPIEIEAALLKHPSLHNAAISVKIMPNGRQGIVGYLVLKKNKILPTDKELRQFLKIHLPLYMIPHQWVFLDSFPLTLSGKLDRNGLPDPAWKESIQSGNNLKVNTELERQLLKIWENVLNICPLFANDNFFTLGGDSLSAIAIASKACTININFRPQDILKYQTISALAHHIEKEIKLPQNDYLCFLNTFDNKLKSTLGKEIYPTTLAQQGMIFHSLQNPHSGIYLNQIKMNLNISINKEIFFEAWNALLTKYDFLRIGFIFDEIEYFKQVVYPACKLRSYYQDVRKLSAIDQDRAILHYQEKILYEGFDFEKPPLWHIALIQLDSSKYTMIYTDHHAISDGITQGKLFNEFFNLYTKIIVDKLYQLSPNFPFFDYTKWVSHQKIVLAEKYWMKQLRDVEPFKMDIDKSILLNGKISGACRTQVFSLSETQVNYLKKIARIEHVTVNTVVQASWAILLSQYCRCKSPKAYGLIESGRQIGLPHIYERIGVFIQTVPIVISLKSGTTVKKLLKTIQLQSLQSSEYGYALENIQRNKQDVQSPLFNYVITFPDYTVEQLIEKQFVMDGFNINNFQRYCKTHYLLTAVVIITKTKFEIEIQYDPNNFSDEAITQFKLHWAQILHDLSLSVNDAILSLPFFLQNEKKQFLSNVPCEKINRVSVLKKFELNVINYPHAFAIVADNNSITYTELNRRANMLANYLISNGIAKNTPIAVFLPRGIDLIICMLAIFKMGGIYVPLNVSECIDKVKETWRLLSAVALITVESSQVQISNLILDNKTKVIFLDKEKAVIEKFSSENLDFKDNLEDIAYVFFTSGSTGKPKGVAQTHRTLVNLISWQAKKYPIYPAQKISQLAHFTFDVFLQELWCTFYNGAELHIVNDEVKHSISKLLRFIDVSSINCLFLPTAMLDVFSEAGAISHYHFAHLKYIIVAGEALYISKNVRAFFKKFSQIMLLNQYGPTETHVVSSFNLEGSDADTWPMFPPIGAPIDNTQFYILNKYKQQVPWGVAGELYIEGHNLASHYWKNIKETNNKFLELPVGGEIKTRLYRTGDKVIQLENNMFQYLGRLDQQVKIRGFRIEIPAIEQTLLKLNLFKQCKVLVKSCKNNYKKLVCYIAVKSMNEKNRLIIRQQIRETLPSHMIPEEICWLEEFPLTKNGKIDRHKLLRQDFHNYSERKISYNLCSESLKLLNICKEILQNPYLDMTDNLFDKGMNSLHILRLMFKIEKLFNLRISIREIMSTSSILQLSDKIKKNVITSQ